MIRKIYMATAFILFTICAISQSLTIPPDGGNKRASVSERIGITDVTIHYDRPGVKGREGKIWNNLVQTGFTDLGFGTSKAAPWRAGANENTTITFSTGVPKEALEVFKLNARKNPGQFTTDMGLVRGYSANGDYKNALKYAKLAEPLAPNKPNKDAVDNMIQILNEGKDVN